ncbi:hypothetical protein GOV09_04750 [Candidatus Woesearchaeota archaeon]|nr:hypothetical protein [Candidatus Woesearchaeota archaeon]
MCFGCAKCSKMGSILLLVVGIIYVIVDLGHWNFWGLQWWTIVFLFMGITGLAMGTCKTCQVEMQKK